MWLSAVAMRSVGRGLSCVGSATAGAVLGGAVMHRWGARVPARRSASVLSRLPAVSPAMITRVEREMPAHRYTAVLLGPLRGTPYKLYARAAGLQGDPLLPFLAWSVPARAPRFVLVTAGVGGLSELLRTRCPGLPEGTRWAVFAAGWTAFYAWYFRTVGRD